MNIVFLTLSGFADIERRGLYEDLMRKFRDEGHGVYIVSPAERRTGVHTHVVEQHGVKVLKVRTLNIQKTNVVEKGLGTLLIEGQFRRAIRRYWGNVRFDLITYSTPPITFTNVVRDLKRRNPGAVSYLQLKDIFPQNAVDIGMFGERSVFNWYFRKKEVALYKASDYIGCMSPANVAFVQCHNPYYPADHVEVAPNAVELREEPQDEERFRKERCAIRRKYALPTDKPVFIYGGNLGKPQGIDYLMRCLEANKRRTDCSFVVIGNGTEYPRLKAWYDRQCSGSDCSVRLMERLPKEDYELLVKYCDVGLIFLDHRFTIPNYPSRLLSYLEHRVPVLCATDVNTDLGRIAEEHGYGYWCESVRPENFTALVDRMLAADRKAMGERGYAFLKENYLVGHTYQTILRRVEESKRQDTAFGMS